MDAKLRHGATQATSSCAGLSAVISAKKSATKIREWCSARDEDGNGYFYNRLTQESRWDLPPGISPVDIEEFDYEANLSRVVFTRTLLPLEPVLNPPSVGASLTPF